MARWIGLSVLALALACRSSLPTPDVRAHPLATTKFVEVPYPPPAARPEIIPPKPREGAVWVDGEWAWRGKQWAWDSGAWVMPPAKAYFSPWVAFRQSNGALRFAPGAWHRDDGQQLSKPTPLALAQPTLDVPAAASPKEEDAGP